MKIALASAQIVDRQIDFNRAQTARYMKAAKAEGADLFCFCGAMHFLDGAVHQELPIFTKEFLYVTL